MLLEAVLIVKRKSNRLRKEKFRLEETYNDLLVWLPGHFRVDQNLKYVINNCYPIVDIGFVFRLVGTPVYLCFSWWERLVCPGIF